MLITNSLTLNVMDSTLDSLLNVAILKSNNRRPRGSMELFLDPE